MSAELHVRELSAPGRGAVSVLSFEGPGAAAWLEESSGRPLPPAGRLALLRLRQQGLELDEALLVALGPEQFELHVHGSPPLVRRLLALSGAPARQDEARPVELRAAQLLARASGTSAARMLLDQAEGALRRELGALAQADPELRRRALDELEERARVARRLVDPPRVVIAGPANAGKSTLFNVLLGEARALVHAQAGTTRDVLREPAHLGAYTVWLHDTAGERAHAPGERDAEVEGEGQRRARSLAAGADIVLWLSPAGTAPAATDPQGAQVLRLRSRSARADLGAEDALAALEEPEHARLLVARQFRAQLRLPEQPWRPGVGVPFDAALDAGVAQLDPRATPASWTARVRELLGPEPAGFDCLLGPHRVR